HTNSSTTPSCGFGVLASNTEAPVVSQTPVSTNLLQTFDVFTKFVVKLVGKNLTKLAITNILLSIQKPVGNLVLARVLHDRDDAINLIIGKLPGAFRKINVGFFAHQSANVLTSSP
uniref:Uncharacterized protein n=1 Tax=Ciona intestinalis TaxID=7719 RepID=F6RW16_CIOIN